MVLDISLWVVPHVLFCDWYVSSSSSSFRVRCLVRFLGLRGSRVCLVGVLHFLRFLFFFLLGLHISMGLGCFPVLCIGSDPAEVSGSGRTGGESDGLVMVVHRGVSREPPLPLGKGKGKISDI